MATSRIPFHIARQTTLRTHVYINLSCIHPRLAQPVQIRFSSRFFSKTRIIAAAANRKKTGSNGRVGYIREEVRVDQER